MNVAAALLLLVHGFAHLVGFVGTWRLSSTVPFKSTVLNGRWDLGEGGAKVYGLLWLVTALVFAVAAVGAFTRASWWGVLTLAVALFSSVLCILSWPEAKIGLFVNVALIAVAAVELLSRGKDLENLYQAEVRTELANHPAGSPPLITGQDITGLPAPVQRYFRSNGYVGKPHTLNMRLRWKQMRLKRSPDADWMDLSCQQFNSVASPMRTALMKGRIAGFIPFEGRDKYQDGHGSMRIQAAKVFTVGDSTGTAMDTSGLVTVLSESLLAPSYALQGYMKWQPVDDHTARAELTHNGLTVSGTFHFNEKDELIRFDSDDRWQDGTPPRRLPWSATLGDYRDVKGIRYPTRLSATWHEPDGDLTYVEGTLEAVEFNVKD